MKCLTLSFLALFASLTLQGATPVVVLPERFRDYEVVVKESENYKSLVSHNRKLAKVLQQEIKDHQKYRDRVDKQLRDQSKEIDDLRKANEKLKKKGFTSILFGVLNIAVMFFTNPLGYMMQTGSQIIIGAVVVLVMGFGAFLLIKFLYKKVKK